MKLQELCSLVDQYYIAEHKAELNKRYLAMSETIITDGTNTHYVDADGYVNIKDVDAEYIIFFDSNSKLYLGIYKYIQDNKFKEILDGINTLRRHVGNAIIKPSTNVTQLENGLVDVNNMTCTECGSTDFSKFSVSASSNEIECTCKNCKTKFKLIPSKYYIIKSKTIFMGIENAAHLNQ